MHAHVIAAERGGQLTAGRWQGEVRALVEGSSEPFGTELFGEVPHAGQTAVLPVAQLAEESRHPSAEFDSLVRPDEEVDVGGHALAIRETSADQHVEADRAVCMLRRPQADVVDLDPGTVLRAARHCDLELAWQVAYSRLPVKNAEIASATGSAATISF